MHVIQITDVSQGNLVAYQPFSLVGTGFQTAWKKGALAVDNLETYLGRIEFAPIALEQTVHGLPQTQRTYRANELHIDYNINGYHRHLLDIVLAQMTGFTIPTDEHAFVATMQRDITYKLSLAISREDRAAVRGFAPIAANVGLNTTPLSDFYRPSQTESSQEVAAKKLAEFKTDMPDFRHPDCRTAIGPIHRRSVEWTTWAPVTPK